MYLTVFKIYYSHRIAPPSSYIVIFWRNIGIVYTIITYLIYYFHMYCTTFKLHHNFPEKSSCPVKHTLRYGWRDVQEMHVNVTSRQVYLLTHTIPATGYPCRSTFLADMKCWRCVTGSYQFVWLVTKLNFSFVLSIVPACMCAHVLGEGAVEKLSTVTLGVCINISRGQDNRNVDIYLVVQ